MSRSMERRHLGGREIAASLHRAVEFREAIERADKQFFSPYAETDVRHHNLPHWGQCGAIVFITFRLADSMPATLLAQWRCEREAWLLAHPEPWDEPTAQEYAHVFQERMEKWLDAGHGRCVLARPDCNGAVAGALEHFHGERYTLHSYIVMPNHVHVLMELFSLSDLPKTLHSWKSFTAKKICRILGEEGAVWQRDYFDRIIRSDAHYQHCIEYIRKNERQAAAIAAGTAAPHTPSSPLL